ncbi:MAG: thermonuclease family protein [Rhodospirillaceae bacterium]
MRLTLVYCVMLLIAVGTRPGLAQDPVQIAHVHTVPLSVIRVVDGDTIRARATIWPGTEVEVSVRLRGIDAPELRKGDCTDQGRAAQEWLEALVVPAQRVWLLEPKFGTYAGRVIGDVIADDVDVAAGLVERGLAAPYQPGGPRFSC